MCGGAICVCVVVAVSLQAPQRLALGEVMRALPQVVLEPLCLLAGESSGRGSEVACSGAVLLTLVAAAARHRLLLLCARLQLQNAADANTLSYFYCNSALLGLGRCWRAQAKVGSQPIVNLPASTSRPWVGLSGTT